MLREITDNKRILSAIASGALLSAAFPNPDIWPLAYIAFVPLLFVIRGLEKIEAFYFSYIFGFVFFVITMFWLRHVSIPGGVFLIAVLSVFFGLFGSLFAGMSAGEAMLSILILPAYWVGLEYIRSNLFTGFGWALLGYSQYKNLHMIQISDMTGAYGVSFIVIMVNILIYTLLSGAYRKGVCYLIVSISIVAAALWYGHGILLEKVDEKQRLRVSVIQGNIPQDMKWEARERDVILERYSTLTRKAALDGPELIVWPETSLPGFIEEEDLLEKAKALAREAGADLLIGAPSFTEFPEERLYNSAFLISKEGDIKGQYDKVHPVPFGEYVPFNQYLGFIRKFVDKPIGDFAKGTRYTVFSLDNGAQFGVLICFEDIFSNLVRVFAAKRADFMVNMTNDAWFMKTSAPYQHAQSSVFRAVENRVPVIRAANTGLSCFIDRCGRIFDRVSVEGADIFVAGYKTSEIILSGKDSFYKRYGDVFAGLCLIIILIKGGLVWLRRLS